MEQLQAVWFYCFKLLYVWHHDIFLSLRLAVIAANISPRSLFILQ